MGRRFARVSGDKKSGNSSFVDHLRLQLSACRISPGGCLKLQACRWQEWAECNTHIIGLAKAQGLDIKGYIQSTSVARSQKEVGATSALLAMNIRRESAASNSTQQDGFSKARRTPNALRSTR
jgi:hypothetical protein